MRGWRWNGADAALGVGLGMMLLGLSLAQSFPTDNACPAVDGLQNLTQPEYQNTVVADTGVAFMASLVHSFLHSVQPNPFPTGQCHPHHSLIVTQSFCIIISI